MSKPKSATGPAKPNLLHLLKPYKGAVIGLLIFALLSNALNLVVPKIIQKGIDDYTKGIFDMNSIILSFGVATLLIFVFLYLQSIVQTYVSEKVARDLRKRLSAKISQQSFTYIQDATPGKLLTNLTSDVDAIKMFV